MKKAITIALVLTVFLLACCMLPAKAQVKADKGVQFFKGSWTELLQAAKQQQKLIFVDIYTEWCGPCKEMSRTVFPTEMVGNKYNPLFLNYKLDAEKGEGIDIAKKFNISAYPTCLYLNSNGYLIHRVTGESNVTAFNQHADKAAELAADKNALGNLEAEFQQGNRSLDFLRTYISKKTQLDIDNSIALDEYFKAVPTGDLTKEETLLFLGRNINSTQTGALVFLMSNYDLLSENAKEQLKSRLYEQFVRAALIVIKERRFLEFQQLMIYTHKIGKLNEKQLAYLNRVKLTYFGLVKDIDSVKKEGYQMVGNLMNISIDSIQAQDARQYNKFMRPFLSGEMDSTKFPSFQEEKVYLINTYSREIASPLYTVASLFCSTLPATDKALQDALQWAIRVQQLMPAKKEFADLIARLKGN
jgi:thiol-disulfide isomerase/thioredoxin